MNRAVLGSWRQWYAVNSVEFGGIRPGRRRLQGVASQPEPKAAAYHGLAEPQAQAKRSSVNREPSTAIVDQGLGTLGITAAVPVGQVEQVLNLGGCQSGEQGAFPGVGVGMPAQRQFFGIGAHERCIREPPYPPGFQAGPFGRLPAKTYRSISRAGTLTIIMLFQHRGSSKIPMLPQHRVWLG